MTTELVTAILMGVMPHKEVPVMDQITAATIEAQNKYGIEAELLLAMIKTESNFNPKAIGRAKEVQTDDVLRALGKQSDLIDIER